MVSDITESAATGSGMVISDGGSAVTERGICWSTNANPTIEDTHASCGSGIGEFSCLMPHLTEQTTYYIRAYAVNAVGFAYGEVVSFTVGQNSNVVLPTVVTEGMSSITTTTAVCGGNVVDDGGATVTERGICWGPSPNPTMEGSHANNGTGTGAYTCMMTGLTPNTTYYVRAYAKNRVGVSYGDEIEFTTEIFITLPSLVTNEVTDITQTAATGGGTILDNGGATITDRGVCWSTSHNPTINDSHAAVLFGGSLGAYTVQMTGLSPNTTYYVRAYAINSVGVAYGNEVYFTTMEEVSNNVTIILTAGDVWGDGSGYQMLLDPTHSLYGTTIPETGALSTNCSGNEDIYNQFEYKVPTNADGNCATQNIVFNNSITTIIPAGTYDWCITNPVPGDRIWIVANTGNVGGRENDYVFEGGKIYEFVVSAHGSNDGVDVTITDGKGNNEYTATYEIKYNVDCRVKDE